MSTIPIRFNIPFESKRTTQRGVLRAPSERDFEAIVTASRAPGFNDGMTWDPPQTLEELAEPLERAIKEWRDGVSFTWSMDDRVSGAVIGRFGIRPENVKAGLWSIGYWVHPDYQARGYATEGAMELLSFGFAELKATKIVASHAKWNEASGKVLQNIGMKLSGETDHGFQKHGEWVAEYDYEISRSEFLTMSGAK